MTRHPDVTLPHEGGASRNRDYRGPYWTVQDMEVRYDITPRVAHRWIKHGYPAVKCGRAFRIYYEAWADRIAEWERAYGFYAPDENAAA